MENKYKIKVGSLEISGDGVPSIIGTLGLVIIVRGVVGGAMLLALRNPAIAEKAAIIAIKAAVRVV